MRDAEAEWRTTFTGGCAFHMPLTASGFGRTVARRLVLEPPASGVDGDGCLLTSHHRAGRTIIRIALTRLELGNCIELQPTENPYGRLCTLPESACNQPDLDRPCIHLIRGSSWSKSLDSSSEVLRKSRSRTSTT